MNVEVERLRVGMRLVSSAIAAFADATGDYRRLLTTVAQNIAESIRDSCVVLLIDDSGRLEAAAIYDEDPEVRADLIAVYAKPLGKLSAVIQDVMTSGKPRLTPKVELADVRERVSPEMFEVFARLGVHGGITVPMRVHGTTIGVISVVRHRPEERPLDELDCEITHDLAGHAALAIANARLVEALRDTDDIKLVRDELVQTNRFLDAIVEHIPDMVFVKDAERLAFSRFNRAGEELLGVKREELIGKNDHDFFPATEAAHFQQKDRETLAAGKLVEIAEEPIQTRHGPRWLHTKKVPILDDDGKPMYLLGISHDITELKAVHAALVAAKDDAVSASQELESFSYSVAHDLRAPLRAIDGFSQALLDDYGDRLDPAGHRHIQRVREAAQRMAVLIDDLLALSRVTRAELNRRPVDVSALARGSLERQQRAEPHRHALIVIQPDLTADADPRLLSIALDNLFGNAWKFTSKKPEARIELGSEVQDGERVFFIRDNGAGFDTQYVHKLFGVFQRLHPDSEFAGTGIGLATVARIIHRHRGRVWAEGSLGAGATFYFTLGQPEAA